MKPQVTRCVVTQTVRMAAVKSAWRFDSLGGLAPSEFAQMYQIFFMAPFRDVRRMARGRRARGSKNTERRDDARRSVGSDHEHPVVDPQVSHFMQVPFRTSVKLPHSPQASPS